MTLLVGGAVAAIAVAGIAETLVDGRGESTTVASPAADRVRGPDVPAPGTLSGTLAVALLPECRLAEIDLATLALDRDEPAFDCESLLASDAGLVAVDRAGERGVYDDGQVVLDEADLRSGLEQPPSGHVHPLGADRRADGLTAVAVAAGPRDIYDVLEDAGLDVDDPDDLEEARELLGLNGPYGALALSAGGSLPRTELQLWRDGKLERSRPLRPAAYPFANRRFGELLRFSPDGVELAVGHGEPGSPVLLLDVETLRTTMRPTVHHGFAWSPDGAYFALSTGTEIRVSGALRSQPAYVLPIPALLLGWAGPS